MRHADPPKRQTNTVSGIFFLTSNTVPILQQVPVDPPHALYGRTPRRLNVNASRAGMQFDLRAARADAKFQVVLVGGKVLPGQRVVNADACAGGGRSLTWERGLPACTCLQEIAGWKPAFPGELIFMGTFAPKSCRLLTSLSPCLPVRGGRRPGRVVVPGSPRDRPDSSLPARVPLRRRPPAG